MEKNFLMLKKLDSLENFSHKRSVNQQYHLLKESVNGFGPKT